MSSTSNLEPPPPSSTFAPLSFRSLAMPDTAAYIAELAHLMSLYPGPAVKARGPTVLEQSGQIRLAELVRAPLPRLPASLRSARTIDVGHDLSSLTSTTRSIISKPTTRTTSSS